MEQIILFDKERSVKACVADGWRIPALGWKRLLASLWAQLLLMALTSAFFVEICVEYLTRHALPAYLLHLSESDALVSRWVATPSLPMALYLLAATVLCIIGCACFLARVYRLVRHYRRENALPAALPIRMNRAEMQSAGRIVLVGFLSLLALLLVSVPVGLAALRWSRWVAIALPVWGIYVWSATHLLLAKHALFRNPLRPSLRYAAKRAFGLAFILQIIILIPTGLAACVCTLPQAVYVCTEMAGNKSLLMGDASGLPAWLPLLFFGLNALGTALCALFSSLRVWTLALKVAAATDPDAPAKPAPEEAAEAAIA